MGIISSQQGLINEVKLNRHLLDIAIRPIRIVFLLGSNPSKRLVNSVLNINTGLWGGIYNLICPTDGKLISDQSLNFIKCNKPDYIAFCGNFQQKRNIMAQLETSDIRAPYLNTTPLIDLQEFGIGIEGIFDSWLTQLAQRLFLPQIGIVDTKNGQSSMVEEFIFGTIPKRIKEYCRDRVDFISVGKYYRERENSETGYDRLTGLLQLTSNYLEQAVRIIGRARPLLQSMFLRRQRVIVFGDENSLQDCCYFWNLRASYGKNNVNWMSSTEVTSILGDEGSEHQAKMTRGTRPVFLTSLSDSVATKIAGDLTRQVARHRQYRYRPPHTILRPVPSVSLISERRTEQLIVHDGVAVVATSMPRAFVVEYPKLLPRWMIDIRVLRDNALETDGLIIPNLPNLHRLLATEQSLLAPNINDDVFSFRVTSRIEQVVFKLPTNWEIIEAIFQPDYENMALSDQGRYMNRTISLFGGLSELYGLLGDERARIILDEFIKHHRTGHINTDARYRRSLTFDDMKKALLSKLGSRSRKGREENLEFAEKMVKDLIKIRAIHSGYQLDCSNCNLEEWYAIDEVTESFRCKRCLSVEGRPLSPFIAFRLNEVFYQAYLNNFTVPVLTLDILARTSRTSFVFSPQIQLDVTDIHSPELDIVAVVDGDVFIGEAKSNDKIKKKNISIIGQVAKRIKSRHVIFSTTSRASCTDEECSVCTQSPDYGDNSFSHGSVDSPENWGTRESIRDLRQRLSAADIQVTSICPEDIVQGAMRRNSITRRRMAIR